MSKNRAPDGGIGPHKIPNKVMEPCASDINMLLMTIPQGQRKQLKPVIMAMRRAYTAHIDNLHRQVSQMRVQLNQLAQMSLAHDDRTREMPRLCPTCGVTEEVAMESGCLTLDDIEAGVPCAWYMTRKAENESERPSEQAPGGSEDEPDEAGSSQPVTR